MATKQEASSSTAVSRSDIQGEYKKLVRTSAATESQPEDSDTPLIERDVFAAMRCGKGAPHSVRVYYNALREQRKMAVKELNKALRKI